jgi:hypothetical protein
MTSGWRADGDLPGEDAYNAIGQHYPLLGALAAETARGGLTNTTSAAVAQTELPREVVEPFLEAAVSRATPDGLGGLGELALLLVSRCGYGHAAAEAAVARPEMPDWGHWLMHPVALEFQRAGDVQWWHDVFARWVRRDGLYYRFLSAHAAELLSHKYAEVRDYLLVPDRGPARLNVDSMLLVISKSDQSDIFVRRWVDWLWGGRFDDRRGEGNESPQIHYACIIDGLPQAPVSVGEVLKRTLLRVKACLHSADAELFDVGCHHLLAMLEREVPFAFRVRSSVLDSVSWTGAPRPAGDLGVAVNAAFAQLVREAGTPPGATSAALQALTHQVRTELARLTKS